MHQSTRPPILAAFFEDHEFGKYLPVDEVTKRLRQDIIGQGFQVNELQITAKGTMFSWRRKGNGRKYQEEFGEAGYQMDVFIVHPQNDWDSSLPTDRHLVERRYQSVNISGSVVGDITQIGKVVRR